MSRQWHLRKIGGHFTQLVDKKLYAFVKSADIREMLFRHYAEIGFIGSDKLREAKLSGKGDTYENEPIADAACTMVEASRCKDGLTPYSRVASSYPFTAREYMWNLPGPPLRPIPNIVFEPSGSVEAFVELGIADGIIDVRETGQTLEDNGITYYKEIMPITTNIVWRNG